MNVENPISHYLDRYAAGDVDEAFFGLLESELATGADLIARYGVERFTETRLFLLRVICERREDFCVPFLGEQLADDEPRIWRQSLDGLVTVASRCALETMRNARDRATLAKLQRDRFGAWLDEAISQVQETLAP